MERRWRGWEYEYNTVWEWNRFERIAVGYIIADTPRLQRCFPTRRQSVECTGEYHASGSDALRYTRIRRRREWAKRTWCGEHLVFCPRLPWAPTISSMRGENDDRPTRNGIQAQVVNDGRKTSNRCPLQSRRPPSSRLSKGSRKSAALSLSVYHAGDGFIFPLWKGVHGTANCHLLFAGVHCATTTVRHGGAGVVGIRGRTADAARREGGQTFSACATRRATTTERVSPKGLHRRKGGTGRVLWTTPPRAPWPARQAKPRPLGLGSRSRSKTTPSPSTAFRGCGVEG